MLNWAHYPLFWVIIVIWCCVGLALLVGTSELRKLRKLSKEMKTLIGQRKDPL